MAFGFNAAFLRALSAIHAICSRVVPYLAKCACANIPIQIAADGAEKGSVHSTKPLALNEPPPPPPVPGVTAARPLSPCALPSHTERKQSTWFASPDATARHALMTEPSWPE